MNSVAAEILIPLAQTRLPVAAPTCALPICCLEHFLTHGDNPTPFCCFEHLRTHVMPYANACKYVPTTPLFALVSPYQPTGPYMCSYANTHSASGGSGANVPISLIQFRRRKENRAESITHSMSPPDDDLMSELATREASNSASTSTSATLSEQVDESAAASSTSATTLATLSEQVEESAAASSTSASTLASEQVDESTSNSSSNSATSTSSSNSASTSVSEQVEESVTLNSTSTSATTLASTSSTLSKQVEESVASATASTSTTSTPTRPDFLESIPVKRPKAPSSSTSWRDRVVPKLSVAEQLKALVHHEHTNSNRWGKPTPLPSTATKGVGVMKKRWAQVFSNGNSPASSRASSTAQSRHRGSGGTPTTRSSSTSSSSSSHFLGSIKVAASPTGPLTYEQTEMLQADAPIAQCALTAYLNKVRSIIQSDRSLISYNIDVAVGRYVLRFREEIAMHAAAQMSDSQDLVAESIRAAVTRVYQARVSHERQMEHFLCEYLVRRPSPEQFLPHLMSRPVTSLLADIGISEAEWKEAAMDRIDQWRTIAETVEVDTIRTHAASVWTRELERATHVVVSPEARYKFLTTQGSRFITKLAFQWSPDRHSQEVLRWLGESSVFCATCFATTPAGSWETCVQCSRIQYCSVECQAGNWKQHKSMCKVSK